VTDTSVATLIGNEVAATHTHTHAYIFALPERARKNQHHLKSRKRDNKKHDRVKRRTTKGV
jgi:hypothetical protein